MKRFFRSFFLCLLIALLAALFSIACAAASAPIITQHPQSYTFPAGSVAVYSVEAQGDNLSYQWYMEFNGVKNAVMDNPEAEWKQYCGDFGSGTDSASFFMNDVQEGLNGAILTCEVSNGKETVISCPAYITIGSAEETIMPPTIKVPAKITVTQNASCRINCDVTKDAGPCEVYYQWYETSTGNLPEIKAVLDRESQQSSFDADTTAIGKRYYVCMVVAVDETKQNRIYSSVIEVETTEPLIDATTVTKLEITHAPNKLDYRFGDAIDLTGLVVRIHTADSYVDKLNGDGVEVSPIMLNNAGEQKIYVSCEGFEQYFTVIVAPKIIDIVQLNAIPAPKADEMPAKAGAIGAVTDGIGITDVVWYVDKNGSGTPDSSEIGPENFNENGSFKALTTYSCCVLLNCTDTNLIFADVLKVHSSADQMKSFFYNSFPAASISFPKTGEATAVTTVSDETDIDTSEETTGENEEENTGAPWGLVIVLAVLVGVLLAAVGFGVGYYVISRKKAREATADLYSNTQLYMPPVQKGKLSPGEYPHKNNPRPAQQQPEKRPGNPNGIDRGGKNN